ncbi:hypothetical protein Fcan01_21105 [Folsomia candida]|uniref:Uncharacterized protein n=1 Tax=Folsomia candida TaxID=158441 RepID=A0A226DEE6_FOLCA|nr:hypothetical protein Fcan01_21105 [Folsomia candida]
MYTYFSMYLLTSLGSTHANIRPGFLYLARTPTSSLILFPSPKVDIFLRLALFNSSHLKHFLHVSISPTSPLQSYRMVSPRWLGVSHWTCSVLIVFLSDTLSEARTYLHLQTNQVEDMRYDDSVLDLPTCRDDSICGFLQANSHGINVQQRCACPGVGARCPLTWDTFDGHSVTMGSDQYKVSQSQSAPFYASMIHCVTCFFSMWEQSHISEKRKLSSLRAHFSYKEVMLIMSLSCPEYDIGVPFYACINPHTDKITADFSSTGTTFSWGCLGNLTPNSMMTSILTPKITKGEPNFLSTGQYATQKPSLLCYVRVNDVVLFLQYCGAAPELKVCANMYTAYTSLMMYAKVKEEDENMLSATSAEKDDEKLVLSSDHLKCICPETHNYVLVHKGFSSPEVDTEAIHLSYICSPLGTCSAGEPCKTLSSTPSQFLVQRKCNCPSGLRCPTETTKGITSTLWNKGFSFEIRCQK